MSQLALNDLSPAIRLLDGRYFMVSRQRWLLHYCLKDGTNRIPNSGRAILPYLDAIYGDALPPDTISYSGFTLDQFRQFTAAWPPEDRRQAIAWIKSNVTQNFLGHTLRKIQAYIRDNPRVFEVTKIPFHSYLGTYLGGTRQKTATAKQWQGTLAKVPGLRPEEIALSGVSKLWAECNEDDQLTRDELLAHLDFRACQPVLVSEAVRDFRVSSRYIDMGRRVTRKARYVPKPPSYCIERYRHASMGYRILLNRYRDLSPQEPIWLAINDKWQLLALTRDDGKHTRFQTLDEAKASIEADINRRFENYGHTYAHTQWDSYVTPGGRDYREHFLVLANWPELYVSPHFDLPNILIHLRTTLRTDIGGEHLFFLEELQSDWHQIGKRHGYDSQHPDSPPFAPFALEWAELGLKTLIFLAMRAGIDRIAWTSGQLQEWRYRCDRPGLVTFYDRTLPKMLKKLATWNVALTHTVIETKCVQGLIQRERGYWFVCDENDIRISKRYKSRHEAQEWQLRQAPRVQVEIPMITLTNELKAHLRKSGWALFGRLGG